MKKLFSVILLALTFQIFQAQNEFVTIWEPGFTTTPEITVNAPYQAGINQIWFPGIGENYTIEWEEVGAPQNNGIMTNVTSTSQVLIDFGPVKEGSNGATRYRVKVSNGNGIFRQIKFASHLPLNQNIEVHVPVLQFYGNVEKIREVEQWGNIVWDSMHCAFTNCQKLQITAADAPNLSMVTDASLMFYKDFELLGASSMQNWDTSNIQNFSFMFASHYNGLNYSVNANPFNSPYITTWDMSSATNLSYMFTGKGLFNQNLNSWDVSNVQKMNWMFTFCTNFNQPLNNWNTESVQDMHYMFGHASAFNQPINSWNTSQVINLNRTFAYATSFNQPLDAWNVGNATKMTETFTHATSFNQPLNSWNVSNVTNMTGMFHTASSFNQPLSSWNTSKVTSMWGMFIDNSSFNQSLETWNLSALVQAQNMLANTGLDCINYSKTLSGWADNPVTPNSIDLGTASPLVYAANIVPKRNFLISKGWTIADDTMGTCVLSIRETATATDFVIYPNPASDFIFFKDLKDGLSYKVFDNSGRIVLQGKLNEDKIDVRNLSQGNYLLQIKTKSDMKNHKFLKQ
ncbi:BspA family leucine-rich repeat surface protein [Chryseobacterium foetidum]|uniref:BspA family leucine-rich repeat surface protein n=1 Tax=Chryseobacterium foetidum TaxID=2951057 RepID=UPI0021C99154|nr:BspA family leucine-rich repeat surface protein [Chryseobacterium foetidum]